MHLTGPLSRYYDAAALVAPERRGAVAWGLFNTHYDRLQHAPWQRINDGVERPWYLRWLRTIMARSVQRSGVLLDLERKASLFRRMPLPANPDVVFFGAEVGWEALVIQALFGGGGRVVLVDCDPAAYARFQAAPTEKRVRAPRGFPQRELILRKERVEYLQQDFFDGDQRGEFDVGLDWGLLEHYAGDAKIAVLGRFRDWLRADGFQISAVPRDTWQVRMFYRVFADELNFGYRELLRPPELAAALAAGGFAVQHQQTTSTSCVALSRPKGPSSEANC